MDDDLLAYALNHLGPADKAAVEARLRADPAAAEKLARLQRVLAPLAADKEAAHPPHGLAISAIARVAEEIVRAGTAPPPVWPRGPRDGPVFAARRPVELAIAAGIGFLAFGLILGGVQKLRRDSQEAACRNNLRALHTGLTDYADTHTGRFPQVDGAAVPTAGAFVTVLVQAGQLPPDAKLVCPADPMASEVIPANPLARVGYTYTLGYRGPTGGLIGARRSDPEPTPLAADLPAPGMGPAGGPESPHRRGQNVLFADGHTMFCTVATVGPGGDDIYRNDLGLAAAGVRWGDTALGRPGDVP